jgi:hypothetical protein
MGFVCKWVWVMGYCGPMGYCTQIPAHQVSGQLRLWVIRGYGLSEVWDKRVSTVYVRHAIGCPSGLALIPVLVLILTAPPCVGPDVAVAHGTSGMVGTWRLSILSHRRAPCGLSIRQRAILRAKSWLKLSLAFTHIHLGYQALNDNEPFIDWLNTCSD